MKITKIVIVTVCLLMVSAVLYSGGQEEEANKTEASDFNATGYPIVNTPITLTAVTSDDVKLEDYPMYQKLAELTNVNTSTEAIGGDGFSEKKALLLASGDLPDMFFGEGLKSEDIATNIDYFVDLAPLIEMYAQNIKAMFVQDPWTKKLARIAGTDKIYGMTGVRAFRPKSMDSWFINQTWLDNLGLEIPETLDEFEAVLIAFRDKDANGNGDPNDELPFTANGNLNTHQSWRQILNSYGVTNPTYDVKQQVRDGKVQYIYAQEGAKLAIQYMRRLYEQELVYPDIMIAGYGDGIREYNTPEACRVGVYVNWHFTSLYKDQYVSFPAMEGTTGIREVTTAFPGRIRGKQNLFEMTVFNEYPEATIRWLDWMYSEEGSVQTFFGSFGVGIEKTDTGYRLIDGPDGIGHDLYKWLVSPADGGPVYITNEIEEKIANADVYYGKLDNDAMNDPYRQPVEYSFPMVTFGSDVSDEVAELNNDIHSFSATKVAQWITEGGIEDEWDAYLAQLNNMGLKRYLELYQAAYDEFMR